MTEGPDIPTDETLAADAGRDVTGAFDQIARRYQMPLRRFLARCVAAADIDDVLQESFVRLYVARGRFDPRRRFKPWAFTVAQRAAIDHLRARRKTVSLSREPTVVNDPAAGAAANDEHRFIWTTAARVTSGEQLRALWLFYGEAMSVREIAMVMNRSSLVVRAFLSRGRARLRAAIVERPIDPRPINARPMEVRT